MLREILCEIFNIDSIHHEMYKYAVAYGAFMEINELQHLILHLAKNIPKTQPFKTCTICQIRGYSDALIKKEKQ